MAAFVLGVKHILLDSADVVNLTMKHPLTGKPMVPYKVRVFSTKELTVIPQWLFNDGVVHDSAWPSTADAVLSNGIILPANFQQFVLEGPMKAVTIGGTAADIVFVTAYFDGTEHNKVI